MEIALAIWVVFGVVTVFIAALCDECTTPERTLILFALGPLLWVVCLGDYIRERFA